MGIPLKCLTERQKDLIRILYKNEGISQTRLNELLGGNRSAVSQIISNALRFKPPLIRREYSEKNRCYFLTDYGKKYFEPINTFEEAAINSKLLNATGDTMKPSPQRLNKAVKRVLRLLYVNSDGLNIKELNRLLDDESLAATCNKMCVISHYNPPLIRKRKDGTYFLTKYGEECCASLDFFDDINDGMDIIAVNNDLKRIIITNILNEISNDNPDILVLGLKNLGVDAIMNAFDLLEFYFLCLLLGIWPESMSPMSATGLVLHDSSVEERAAFTRTVYEKLNKLLTEEFLNKRFGLSTNEGELTL